MAGLVGKEDVFEKHKTNSFWNGLNFNNKEGIWLKENFFDIYFIRKHQNNSFAILWSF